MTCGWGHARKQHGTLCLSSAPLLVSVDLFVSYILPRVCPMYVCRVCARVCPCVFMCAPCSCAACVPCVPVCVHVCPVFVCCMCARVCPCVPCVPVPRVCPCVPVCVCVFVCPVHMDKTARFVFEPSTNKLVICIGRLV